MKPGHYEHIREIKLDRTGRVVQFVIQTVSENVPASADALTKDMAATLSMYAKRLEPFPSRIVVQLGEFAGSEEGPNNDKTPDLMEKVEPRFGLDEFVCEDYFRQVLDDVVFYARRYPDIRAQIKVESVTWQFLVNFFGESGTGKTMAAEAIARELGKDLFVMNFANVESSLLGRTTKNITRAFREIDPAKSLIMLDEADAFVSRRITDLRQGAEYALNTARGQIINEIDRFNGTIILATNLFGTYDNAVLRRIKFNLQFELPSAAAITAMYRNYLGSTDFFMALNVEELAAETAGLSGGDVYNISEIIIMKSLQKIEQESSQITAGDIHQIVSFYRSKSRAGGRVQPAANENSIHPGES